MSRQRNAKKVLASILALTLAAGYFPADVGIFGALSTGTAIVASAEVSPEVTFDLTVQGSWGIPTSGNNNKSGTYSNGTYTIGLSASTNFKQNSGYLLLGKNGSYLELPEFDFDVEKIVVNGASSASDNVKLNVYVNDYAVSTAATGMKSSMSFDIDSEYQSQGNVYKIKILNDYNAQISSIDIYKKESTTPTKVNVTGVELNTNETTLTVGKSETLTATVSPDGATDNTVIWSSSDTSVATVSDNGTVTAVSAGTATITATATNGTETTDDDKSATCAVTVNEPAMIEKTITITGLYGDDTAFDITNNGFRFTGDSADEDGLNYGDPVTITAPESSTIKSLEFTTSYDSYNIIGYTQAAPGNVSISEHSVTVTNINSNSVVISNTKNNDGWIQFNAVTITYGEATKVDVTGVELNTSETTLTVGKSETLTATLSPDGAIDDTVIWSSSDTSVATVSDNGTVTAVSAGTATITATATNGTETTDDDKSATCAVTVNEAPVQLVSCEIEAPETIYIGDDVAVQYKLTFNKAPTFDDYGYYAPGSDLNSDSSDFTTSVDGNVCTITLTYTNVISSDIAGEAHFSIIDFRETSPSPIASKKVTVKEHEHSYSASWSADDENHWHDCISTDGECNTPKTDVAAHTYGTSGDARFTCTVCEHVNETRKANAEAADAVAALINALPARVDVTLDNEEAIKAARNAYDALTEDKKAFITARTTRNLTSAESGLSDAKAAAPVEQQILDLPAAENVDVTDKEAITAAATAFTGLGNLAKGHISTEAKQYLRAAEAALAAAEADQEAADAVKYKISCLPAKEDVKVSNETAIVEARSAYNALTADQKKRVLNDALTKLTNAEEGLDDAKAANNVENKLNALPAKADVTIADKSSVETARAAYNGLTTAQISRLSEAAVAKLTDAEAAIQQIEDDMEAAETVENKITALPAADKIKLSDEEAVAEARSDYNALTEAQKKYVSDDAVNKLTAAEEAIAKMKADKAAADAVTATINALPAPNKVTLNNKEAILAAKSDYDKLTNDQLGLVSDATKNKLNDDIEALARLDADVAAAKAFEDEIDALPEADDITLDDKADVEAARKAYNELTEDQKALVTEKYTNKLNAAENAVNKLEADKAAAEEVMQKLDALPNADMATIADKAKVEAARKAYDALTDDQKALINANAKKNLENCEDAIAKQEADRAAIEAVEAKINALPAEDKVTLDNKADIAAARKALNALTEDQRKAVSGDAKAKLEKDEAAIEKLEADKAAAKACEDMINDLPAAADITPDDTDAVAEARGAFDALTDAQKAYLDPAAETKLKAAEASLDKLNKDNTAADKASDMIGALPEFDQVTAGDKDAIEAARAAYDALTDDQKALVDDKVKAKLADAETALKLALEDQEEQTSDEEDENIGDVDGNGRINASDIVRTAAHIKGLKKLDDSAKKRADVDKNGKINASDIAKIAAHIKGLKLLNKKTEK